MSELKVSEVLDLAADEIQRRGWFSYGDNTVGAEPRESGQDPWGGGAGSMAPVCLEGGIAAALGVDLMTIDLDEGNRERDRALDTLQTCPAYKAVQRYLETDYYLYGFNDTEGRSKEEVIEVLRAAAAVERVKEESLENAEVAA